MKVSSKILFHYLLLLLLLNSWHSFSQSPADLIKPDIGFAVPDSVYAISSTEISARSEEYLTAILAIRNTFPDSSLIQITTSELESNQANINELMDDSTFSDLENFGMRKLDNLQRKVVRNRIRIITALDKIRQASRILENNWQMSIYIQDTWELTRNEESNQDIPEALKQRIDLVIDNNESLLEDIKIHLEEIMGLEDKALNLIKITDQLLEIVNRTMTISYKLMLRKTLPPIWESGSPDDERIMLSERLSLIATDYKNGLTDFYNNYKINLIVHAILFIVILVIVLLLRKISKKRHFSEDDQSFNAFLYIFSRPVAATLLLAFLLTFFIYPKAPVVIEELAELLILGPVIVIALGVVNKKYHGIIFTVLILYILQWLSSTMIIENELPSRLFVFIQTLVTSISIIWWIWSGSMKYGIQRYGMRRLIYIIGLIALAVLSISLIANVLGYIELAYYFTKNVILSATYALILYLCVYVIEGLITMILFGDPAGKSKWEEEKSRKFRKQIRSALRFFAAIIWIKTVMAGFFILDPVLNWLNRIINASWRIREMTFSLKNLLLFILVVFVTIYLTRLVRIFFEKTRGLRTRLPRGVPDMISLVMRYFLAAVGFFIALVILGINLNSLTILLGAVGVGIGFGLQSFFNNLISGFVLVFERPLQVGDVVQFANMEGKIRRIGVRSSTIRTYEGSEVIVPNGHLVSNELINLTLSDPLIRLEVEVGVAYGSDPHQIIELLVGAATSNGDVIRIPKPFATFVQFGDSSLDFKLYFWTNKINERLRIRSEVNLAVYDVLDEEGITIPFPQRDLHFKSMPEGYEPKG